MKSLYVDKMIRLNEEKSYIITPNERRFIVDVTPRDTQEDTFKRIIKLIEA